MSFLKTYLLTRYFEFAVLKVYCALNTRDDIEKIL
jgi:hypothetical protein